MCGGAEACFPKIPSPPSDQKCIGRVFREVVFLYSLRYYYTFQNLSLLIIQTLFSFSDQQNKQNVFGTSLQLENYRSPIFSLGRSLLLGSSSVWGVGVSLVLNIWAPWLALLHNISCPCQTWNSNISALQSQKAYLAAYDSFSDVPESRVWFASKNLTPCRMHWNDFLIGQIIAECHSFPNMYDML